MLKNDQLEEHRDREIKLGWISRCEDGGGIQQDQNFVLWQDEPSDSMRESKRE
jgi:hypothetical protein